MKYFKSYLYNNHFHRQAIIIKDNRVSVSKTLYEFKSLNYSSLQLVYNRCCEIERNIRCSVVFEKVGKLTFDQRSAIYLEGLIENKMSKATMFSAARAIERQLRLSEQ